jgi:hypothetical protein
MSQIPFDSNAAAMPPRAPTAREEVIDALLQTPIDEAGEVIRHFARRRVEDSLLRRSRQLLASGTVGKTSTAGQGAATLGDLVQAAWQLGRAAAVSLPQAAIEWIGAAVLPLVDGIRVPAKAWAQAAGDRTQLRGARAASASAPYLEQVTWSPESGRLSLLWEWPDEPSLQPLDCAATAEVVDDDGAASQLEVAVESIQGGPIPGVIALAPSALDLLMDRPIVRVALRYGVDSERVLRVHARFEAGGSA